MRTVFEPAETLEAIKQRVTPALDTIDDAVRQSRRAIVRGQRAAEDVADTAVRQIKRRPLTAVALAAGAGAFAGGLLALVFAWGRKTSA